MKIDIKDYKTLKELRIFAETQQILITQLMSEAKAKDEDISHLKKMLVDLGNSKVQIFDAAPSDEEIICIEQISKLKQLSKEGILSHKEVESLERLVRTVRQIRKPEKKEEREALPVLTKTELLSLAANEAHEDDNEQH